MAGLVPATHELRLWDDPRCSRVLYLRHSGSMGGRDKPGHDEVFDWSVAKHLDVD